MTADAVRNLDDALGRIAELGPVDLYVVPKGVEHCPKADAEVSAVLFEPQGAVNTGDAPGDRTSVLQELPEG